MSLFRFKYLLFALIVFTLATGYGQETADAEAKVSKKSKSTKKKKKKKVKLPDIDLSNWKVTTPVGKPTEVEPPEILDYANNELLKKYMYNDSTRGALVFYAMPGQTTANTKYSRCELREQMVPGDNNVNWTFAQGGNLKGRLAVDEVSRDKSGKYHKVIIMQIHGRLTNEQRDLIGQKDNNAPPVLKIYWQNGKVRVKTKKLKNMNASDTEILRTDSWTDDKGHTFEQEVGSRPFNLEVDVSEGKMKVTLNKSEIVVYDDIHMKKWGVFENYFKAGNYLQTRDEGASAKVMYFDLEVSH
jgi:hypothetical protein